MDNVSGENDNDENKTLELFCIVYLTAKEFVSLVANGKNEKAGITPGSGLLSPRQFVESKAAKLKDVKLTLIIDGIEKHFRNVKTLQQREYRQVYFIRENVERAILHLDSYLGKCNAV